MDELFKWAVENGWIIPFIAYLMLKDVIPKVFPDLMKRFNEEHEDDLRREDRLFKMLETVVTSNVELKLVIHEMRDFVKTLSVGQEDINRRVIRMDARLKAQEDEERRPK